MTSSVVDVLREQHRLIAELFERVSSPHEERPAVLHAILRELSGHVAAERASLPSRVDEPFANHLHEEHERMEKLMVLIERRKFNSPDVPDLVSELLAASEEHAAWAERELFPHLASRLTPEEQMELGEQLATSDGIVTSHPHPHLLSLGPVADVLTRVASWWDRARDRTAINRQHPEDQHKIHVSRSARTWTSVRGGPDDPVEGSDPSMGGAT